MHGFGERGMWMSKWQRTGPEFTWPGTSADFSLEQAKEERSGCKEKSL